MKVNFYSKEELDLINELLAKGVSSKKAFLEFNTKFPGRTLGAFSVRYYKEMKHKKSNKTSSKLVPRSKMYTTQEIKYLNQLIKADDQSTTIDKARLFVEKYPARTVASVKFKLRSLKKKNNVKKYNVVFYTKEETSCIIELISKGIGYTTAHKEFNVKFPGRSLVSFRQKFYSLKKKHKVKKVDTRRPEERILQTAEKLLDDVRTVFELPFNNETSVEKEITRKVIAQHFSENGVVFPRILTLPADNFIFENKLLSVKPETELICVERNRNTYSKGLNTAVSMNIRYYNSECLDILKSSELGYHNMWLDFCGPYSKSVDEIIRAVATRNLLVTNGYLAITLLGARENCDIFKDYNENTRNVEIPKHICKTIPDLSLVNIYEYKSSGNSPMKVYI
ncbi:MAG: hypothetical protein KDH96_12540, partial [Candidatus Riesia sp.]|nr:hypothetical protein [Candidatus Riesia sp.]